MLLKLLHWTSHQPQKILRETLAEKLKRLAEERKKYSEKVSSFQKLQENSKILRASHHQGNFLVFRPEKPGVQCSSSSEKGVDEVFQTIELDNQGFGRNNAWSRSLTPPRRDSFKAWWNLNVVRVNCVLFNQKFSLDFKCDCEIYGSLRDDDNDGFCFFFAPELFDILLNLIKFNNGTFDQIWSFLEVIKLRWPILKSFTLRLSERIINMWKQISGLNLKNKFLFFLQTWINLQKCS